MNWLLNNPLQSLTIVFKNVPDSVFGMLKSQLNIAIRKVLYFKNGSGEVEALNVEGLYPALELENSRALIGFCLHL